MHQSSSGPGSRPGTQRCPGRPPAPLRRQPAVGAAPPGGADGVVLLALAPEADLRYERLYG
ncbi:hypothetical protein [Streptomyces goshikiensis]|uniref:hypothetical protein n=1 Tax=Streptomyces goshikiensis TaxID=1942 RepID=UPI0036983128